MSQVARFPANEAGLLSYNMLQAYQRDGFLLLENFYTASECDHLRARALQLIEEADIDALGSVFSTRSHQHVQDDYFQTSGDKIRFFLEDGATDDQGNLKRPPTESINKIGHALHDLDPVFDEFSRKPSLENIAHQIGIQQPLLLQSMYIFKSAGIGGEVNCHQDSTFLYTEPLSCTGFWVALEDATIENGCMFALPGEHRQPLKQRFRRDDGQLLFETLNDEVDWQAEAVPLEAKKGTLVLLHGQLPHLSAANKSAHSRHAYALHLIDGACHYPSNNWLTRRTDMPLRGFA